MTYLWVGVGTVGMLQVRLYQPFPVQVLLGTCRPASAGSPCSTRPGPGSTAEPLFLDVVAALAEAHAGGERAVLPLVTGAAYGLS